MKFYELIFGGSVIAGLLGSIVGAPPPYFYALLTIFFVGLLLAIILEWKK